MEQNLIISIATFNLLTDFDNIESMPTDSNQNYYRNLIAEWEEFYNEDFIPLSLNKR